MLPESQGKLPSSKESLTPEKAVNFDPFVYFLHIPKNAGNTVRSILGNNYRKGTYLDALLQGRKSIDSGAKTVTSTDPDVRRLVSRIRAQQNTLACVAANMPFGIHSVLERPVTYFTFLREPVSRCISYWFFVYEHRDDGGELWSMLESYDFDLRRLLEMGAALQFSNDQLRMVTGSSKRIPGKEELKLACELVEERYLFVGAVEHFDACLQMIAQNLGWANVAYERQNVGQKTDRWVLPRRAKQLFREINELDVELYRWLTTRYLPKRLAANTSRTI